MEGGPAALQVWRPACPQDQSAVSDSDDARHVLRRFIGGESMADVISRLGELTLEIERMQRPVLIVSHLATLQALYVTIGRRGVASCMSARRTPVTVA